MIHLSSNADKQEPNKFMAEKNKLLYIFRPHRPFCSNLPSSRRLVSCPRRRRRLSLMASVVTARSFLLFLCVCWHVFSSARQRTVDVWEFYASCVWSTDRQRRPLVLNAQLTSARIGSSEREMKGNPREKKKFTDRERETERQRVKVETQRVLAT